MPWPCVCYVLPLLWHQPLKRHFHLLWYTPSKRHCSYIHVTGMGSLPPLQGGRDAVWPGRHEAAADADGAAASAVLTRPSPGSTARHRSITVPAALVSGLLHSAAQIGNSLTVQRLALAALRGCLESCACRARGADGKNRRQRASFVAQAICCGGNQHQSARSGSRGVGMAGEQRKSSLGSGGGSPRRVNLIFEALRSGGSDSGGGSGSGGSGGGTSGSGSSGPVHSLRGGSAAGPSTPSKSLAAAGPPAAAAGGPAPRQGSGSRGGAPAHRAALAAIERKFSRHGDAVSTLHCHLCISCDDS